MQQVQNCHDSFHLALASSAASYLYGDDRNYMSVGGRSKRSWSLVSLVFGKLGRLYYLQLLIFEVLAK
jgi:hypothetical protein